MIAFKIDIEFIWGFSSNVAGLSKTPQPFLYPPPSTLIGALAASIAKRENFGENEYKTMLIPSLSRNLLAIGVKPLNCIPIRYSDINRIICISRKRGLLYPTPKDITGSFDSPARGKTILSSIDEEPPRLRWIIVFRDKSIRFNDIEINLSEDYIWRINRIGSKESLVSVADVEYVEEVELLANRVNTSYSFPVNKCIVLIDCRGTWVNEQYINPYNISGKWNPLEYYLAGRNIVTFKVPTLLGGEPECIINISCDRYKAYKVDGEVVIGCV